MTGLDPVLRGDASVSLFPTARVSFEDVSLSDNRTGKPALTAEQVVARLRFFPLLIGRIEIADVLLQRPTINIVFNADRSSNWSGHVETLARNLQAEPRQSHVVLRDPDRERHHHPARRGLQDRRDPFERRDVAGVAVDLQELRGHRPLRLAQRNRSTRPSASPTLRRRCAATVRD